MRESSSVPNPPDPAAPLAISFNMSSFSEDACSFITLRFSFNVLDVEYIILNLIDSKISSGVFFFKYIFFIYKYL